MAYNLSPRWRKIITQTPTTLGPNQYYIDDDKFIRKNTVPFLSSSKKVLKMSDAKVYTQAIYSMPRFKRIIGGSSMRSTAERKTMEVKEAPGPADYEPKLMPKKTPRVIPKPVKGKRFYVCRVPYTLEASGPSIPTRIDENGYDFNENGELIKIPACSHDTSLGPAFYNVRTKPTMATLMYKGCEWWKKNSDRNWMEMSNNPGPGTYDVKIKKPFNERDEYVREMARLYSYVPRFIDAIQDHLLSEDLPGPANYTITESRKTKSLSLNPAPFFTKSMRFKYENSDTPGPCAYDLSQPFTKRPVSLEQFPFNIKCPRFASKTKLPTPSPMHYDIPGTIESKLVTTLKSHISAPPFNSTDKRNGPEICLFPSPNQYEVLNSNRNEKKPGDSCVFKSVTNRFVEKAHLRSGEPASYNISEPFNKNRDRKSHNVAKVGFLSTLSRRKILRPTSYYSPSPDTYTGQVGLEARGYSVKQSPRFQGIDNEVPGPGNYKIHPAYDLSVYKSMATHNLRLKENVLHMKLKLPPGKTRDAWNKEIKKHKKLRRFQRPTVNAIAGWINV